MTRDSRGYENTFRPQHRKAHPASSTGIAPRRACASCARRSTKMRFAGSASILPDIEFDFVEEAQMALPDVEGTHSVHAEQAAVPPMPRPSAQPIRLRSTPRATPRLSRSSDRTGGRARRRRLAIRCSSLCGEIAQRLRERYRMSRLAWPQDEDLV